MQSIDFWKPLPESVSRTNDCTEGQGLPSKTGTFHSNSTRVTLPPFLWRRLRTASGVTLTNTPRRWSCNAWDI